jgi:hypothetical protein
MTDIVRPDKVAVRRIIMQEVLEIVAVERVAMEDILTVAESLEVNDDEEEKIATDVLKRIKGQEKRIKAAEEAIVKPVKEGIAYIDGFFKQLLNSLNIQGEAPLKSKLIAYDDRKAAVRRVEQERLRREAAERQAQIDEENRKAADAARLAGDATKAAEIEMAKPTVVVAYVPEVVSEETGTSFRMDWKYEIVNPEIIPREWWILDEKKLGAHARNMKDKAVVPGIRFYAVKGMAARAK